MKLRLSALMFAFVLLLNVPVAPVLAQAGDPVGGCAPTFELHPLHDDHEGDHPHHHVGTDTDKNGDGWICVKHVGNDGTIHVHVDNNVPL